MHDGAESLPLLHIIIKWVHRLEDGLLALLLTSMIGLAGIQILLRNGFDSGLDWADPLLRIMVLWLGLLGAMAASRDNKQISIDVFARMMKGRPYHAVQLLTSSFTSAVSFIISWHALRFVRMEQEDQATLFNELPSWPFEAIIPFVFLIIGCRYALHTIIALLDFINNKPTASDPA